MGRRAKEENAISPNIFSEDLLLRFILNEIEEKGAPYSSYMFKIVNILNFFNNYDKNEIMIILKKLISHELIK